MSFSGQIILIGTSAGGVTALHTLLEKLDQRTKQPIVVIQHVLDHSNIDVRQIYRSGPGRKISEIEDKMPIEENTVYFAPGGYHLLFNEDQTFSLNQEDPVNFSRPSIDLSFGCAAEVFGKRVIAVLLTGANADGAAGLVEVRNAGGRIVVQDPANAEFSEMPKAALNAVDPDFISDLNGLPEIFLQLSGEAR